MSFWQQLPDLPELHLQRAHCLRLPQAHLTRLFYTPWHSPLVYHSGVWMCIFLPFLSQLNKLFQIYFLGGSCFRDICYLAINMNPDEFKENKRHLLENRYSSNIWEKKRTVSLRKGKSVAALEDICNSHSRTNFRCFPGVSRGDSELVSLGYDVGTHGFSKDRHIIAHRNFAPTTFCPFAYILKSFQMSRLCKTKNLLHTKGNYQQNEKVAYRVGKNICK